MTNIEENKLDGLTESQQRRAPAVFISFDDDWGEFAPLLSAMSAKEPTTGQQIEDYKIIDKVGEGAMAVVYKALQQSTGRVVAIKTLKLAERELSDRFAREVAIHEKLKHKNIVEAIDCFTSHGRTYFVMEYLKGINLEDQLTKYGRCNSPLVFAEIVGQVCDALDCAHRQGIIHRDLKPENIILVEDGRKNSIKVLDFGIAKIQEDLQRLTKTGVVLGSPAYMSPEQCMGEDLDRRSDLYSLGIVAFQLITGELPFDADTPMEMMETHCNPNALPKKLTAFRTDLPAVDKLQAVFDHVLETEVDDRTSDMQEFKRELEAWWQEAMAGRSDVTNPFEASSEPAPPVEPEKKSVLKTSEVQSLANLTGRPSPKDTAPPAPVIPNKLQLPLLIGGVLVVLVALIAFLAMFLISQIQGQ